MPALPGRLYVTGDDEAAVPLAREPMALPIGSALDQQVPVPTAFPEPLKPKQRIGTLDASRIAATDPASLVAPSGGAGDPPSPGDDGGVRRG